jgi:hypothetical protein
MELEKAIGLANVAYARQNHLSGDPLFFHTMRVAMSLTSKDERIVAILRYVLEKSAVTELMLLSEGFSEHIVNTLVELLILDGEELEDYAKRIMNNNLAKTVQIAYLTDMVNSLNKENPFGDLQVDKEVNNFQKAFDILTSDNHSKLIEQLSLNADVPIEFSGYDASRFGEFLWNYKTFIGVSLNNKQEEAVCVALNSKATLIQGVVGTGVVQTIHAITKGIEFFDSNATISVFSGGTSKERSYLEKKLNLKVNAIDEVSQVHSDVVIIHALSQVSVNELTEFYELIENTVRMIFVNDPSQIPGEGGVDVSRLCMIPSITLTSGFLNESSDEIPRKLDDDEEDVVGERGWAPPILFPQLMKFSEKPIVNPNVDDVESAIDIYQQSRNLTLTDAQKHTVMTMLKSRSLILTGRAGSGLTETVKSIIECMKLIDNKAEFKLFSSDSHKTYLSNRIGVPITETPIEPFFFESVDLYIIENPERFNAENLEEIIGVIANESVNDSSRILFVGNPESIDVEEHSFDFTSIVNSGKVSIIELPKRIRQ